MECMLGIFFFSFWAQMWCLEVQKCFHPPWSYKEKQQRATEQIKEYRQVHSDLIPEAASKWKEKQVCVCVSGTTPRKQ